VRIAGDDDLDATASIELVDLLGGRRKRSFVFEELEEHRASSVVEEVVAAGFDG